MEFQENTSYLFLSKVVYQSFDYQIFVEHEQLVRSLKDEIFCQ